MKKKLCIVFFCAVFSLKMDAALTEDAHQSPVKLRLPIFRLSFDELRQGTTKPGDGRKRQTLETLAEVGALHLSGVFDGKGQDALIKFLHHTSIKKIVVEDAVHDTEKVLNKALSDNFGDMPGIRRARKKSTDEARDVPSLLLGLAACLPHMNGKSDEKGQRAQPSIVMGMEKEWALHVSCCGPGAVPCRQGLCPQILALHRAATDNNVSLVWGKSAP